MIWMRGARSLMLSGPKGIAESLKTAFATGGQYAFEAETMPKCNGEADKVFEGTIVAGPGDMPDAKDSPQVCGKDASGNRLAFDLGRAISRLCSSRMVKSWIPR